MLLSSILWYLDEIEECENVQRQLVQIGLTKFGLRDERTLLYISSLALIRTWSQSGSKRSPSEVMLLTRNAIQLQHEIGGSESTAKYNLMHDLAMSLKWCGRYEEAEALYNETARSFETTLGPEHSRTMQAFTNWAICLRKQGRLIESRSILEETLRLQLKVLDETDDDVLYTMNGLANCLYDLGTYHAATPYYELLHQEAVESWGPEHSRTIGFCARLGMCYERQDRHEDALELYHQARERVLRKAGEEHPAVLEIDGWIEWNQKEGRQLVWQGDGSGSGSSSSVLEDITEDATDGTSGE